MTNLCKIILASLAVTFVLIGAEVVFGAREYREDAAYDRELIPEKTGSEEEVKSGNMESTSIHEEAEAEEKIEPGNIKTVISPDGMSCMLALDEDGYVWKWEEGKTKADAVVIAELEGIVQIVDTGSGSVYALTEKGDVYAWGINRGLLIDPEADEYNIVFPNPIKLSNLSNIVKMEVSNGRAFAVDQNSRLFVWGLGRYKYVTPDYVPSLMDGYEEQTANVEEIYVGTGDFHYFKRKNDEIFSILLSEHLADDLSYFIVPNFEGEPAVSDWLSDIREGKSERIFDVRVEGGPQCVYLYEMGKKEDIDLISADGFTMYMYQTDGTLWYWNSDMITYHDKEKAGASVERRDLDYSGSFEEADLGEILDMGSDSRAVPQIISISPGIDGALFLLENGEVFTSEYVTTEIKDVEYFERSHGNPQKTAIRHAYDFHLKGLSFRKLNFENIINISSNKNNQFFLVDEDGNIFSYQIENQTEERSSLYAY